MAHGPARSIAGATKARDRGGEAPNPNPARQLTASARLRNLKYMVPHLHRPMHVATHVLAAKSVSGWSSPRTRLLVTCIPRASRTLDFCRRGSCILFFCAGEVFNGLPACRLPHTYWQINYKAVIRGYDDMSEGQRMRARMNYDIRRTAAYDDAMNVNSDDEDGCALSRRRCARWDAACTRTTETMPLWVSGVCAHGNVTPHKRTQSCRRRRKHGHATPKVWRRRGSVRACPA